MKGYFSQLAKQSGLQIAKGNIASPDRDAPKKVEKITPLHREEIVLAPSGSPVSPKKETLESVGNIASQKQDSAARSSAEVSARETSKPSAENSLKPSSPAKVRERVAREKTQREAFFKNENIETEESNFPEQPAVGQIVFAENAPGEITEASKTSDLHTAEIDRETEAPETSDLHSPKIIDDAHREETSERREFFNRTAEILESGMPDKLEAQQILLQEINEWVSAVPAPGETENEVQPVFMPIEKTAFVAGREPAEKSSPAAENLQEQNLNLSIGSITVVVEEPENQPNIAAQNQVGAAQKSGSEKREFSRLSRYYL